MESQMSIKSDLLQIGNHKEHNNFADFMNYYYKSGAISQSFIENIYQQIFFILRDLIKKYTCYDSSSVKDETAVKIYSSIYYALDAYTSSVPSSKLLDTIMKNKVDYIYKQGINTIEECINETKLIYNEVLSSKLSVPVTIYNETIEAFPYFFKYYDYIYAAQDKILTVDYPLAFDDYKKQGVYYMKQYLEKLKLENEFCSYFNKKNLLKVLYSHSHKNKLDLSIVPINIFSIIFEQAIFACLTNTNPVDLLYTNDKFKLLENNLYNADNETVLSLLHNSTVKLIQTLSITNVSLIKYIMHYKSTFSNYFIYALSNKNLINITTLENNSLEETKQHYTSGKRMNDFEFSKLIDELQSLEDISAKLDLITSKIHSLEDFIDMLDSDCIYGNEYSSVLGLLSKQELDIIKEIIGDNTNSDWNVYL